MRIADYLINEKKTYGNVDISNIVQEAEMDFWARVEEMIPESTSSDIPKENTKLRKAMEKAVKAWIDYNIPE